MKRVEITILPQGETQIQTVGFSGNECREASQYLEVALGTTIRDRNTAEFHQAQTESRLRHDTR